MNLNEVSHPPLFVRLEEESVLRGRGRALPGVSDGNEKKLKSSTRHINTAEKLKHEI